MKTSKLLKLLHFLHPKERNELDRYIKASLKNIKKLYGIIQKAKFQADAASLEKAKVWEQLFGKKKKFNNQYLGDIMSKLSKIVEKFMTEKQFEKDENHQNFLLLKALKERGAKNDFLLYYENMSNNMSAKKPTANTFYYEYLHKELLYEFAILNRNEKLDIDLWQVLESFERYSLLNKLRYACAILNEASVIKQSKATQEKATKMAKNIRFQVAAFEEKDAIIELYGAVLQLQMSQLESDFFHVKAMLFSEKNALEKEDILFVATVASNFCSQKIRGGKDDFYAEMFEMYQYMLREGLLEIDGYINPRYAKNIVTLGLKAEKFGWVKDFIENYKEKVTPKWSDSVYHFNLGVYFFYQKDYQKALQYLCLIERFDMFFELDYRILMLKIYYELAETFAFNDLLLSFRKYIDRQTHLTENSKISYYNFLKWSKLLFMQKAKKQAVEQKSLDELKATILLAERKWLLEKANVSGKIKVL